MARNKNVSRQITEIDWDLIQRWRFMNWDAEVAPDDKFTRAWKKKRKNKKTDD